MFYCKIVLKRLARFALVQWMICLRVSTLLIGMMFTFSALGYSDCFDSFCTGKVVAEHNGKHIFVRDNVALVSFTENLTMSEPPSGDFSLSPCTKNMGFIDAFSAKIALDLMLAMADRNGGTVQVKFKKMNSGSCVENMMLYSMQPENGTQIATELGAIQ